MVSVHGFRGFPPSLVGLPDGADRASKLAECGRLQQRLRDLEGELGLDRPSAPADAVLLDTTISEIVVSHASDMISVHSANGDYLYASPSTLRLFGWEPSALVGQSAYALFHPDDIARIASDHARHASGGPGGVRYRLKCGDASYRWVETNSEADASGRIPPRSSPWRESDAKA